METYEVIEFDNKSFNMRIYQKYLNYEKNNKSDEYRLNLSYDDLRTFFKSFVDDLFGIDAKNYSYSFTFHKEDGQIIPIKEAN